MKNDCKNELLTELRLVEKNTIILTGIEQSLLQQKETLNRLFSLYKLEIEHNINITDNFPIAYKYIKEVQHEFQCLLKYSMEERFTTITLLRYNDYGLKKNV